MKSQKVTLMIEVEVLSIDVVESSLITISEHIKDGYNSGELSADDGDFVKWHCEYKEVEI